MFGAPREAMIGHSLARVCADPSELNELIADAKARPKAISVGHSGIGSHTHLCLIALFHAAGAEVNEVPFGAAQVVPSLIGGHVELAPTAAP